MTLRQYLENHNIKATPDQRSQIGKIISKLEHNYDYVKEESHTVKFYDESFLSSLDVSVIIINHLTK